MGLHNYDPANVKLVAGPVLVEGYAEGSMVNVESNADLFTLQTGSDGESTRSKSNNRSARVTSSASSVRTVSVPCRGTVFTTASNFSSGSTPWSSLISYSPWYGPPKATVTLPGFFFIPAISPYKSWPRREVPII